MMEGATGIDEQAEQEGGEEDIMMEAECEEDLQGAAINEAIETLRRKEEEIHQQQQAADDAYKAALQAEQDALAAEGTSLKTFLQAQRDLEEIHQQQQAADEALKAALQAE